MSGVVQALLAAYGAAKDAYFKYVTLLLPGNGTNGAQNNTFLDSSTNNFTITRNGNTTQGTFTPYGSNWSNYFTRASSQYLTVSNSGGQFSFGTGAFTIECWVNLASMPSGTGYPASYWLFGGGPLNSNTGIDFYINNTQIGFNLTDFTSPTAIGNHGMSVGVWYHVAVIRGGASNQTLSIYVNGTRVATASSVTATADAATSGIAISAAEPSGSTGGNFDGYISNHRIVKGTAVYDPTQTTITVPTAPLTAITNTSLLTCQSNRFIDNSTNAFAITVNGSPSVQRFSPFAPTTPYAAGTIGGSGYFDGSGDYLSVAASANQDFGSSAFTVEFWWYPNADSRQWFYHASTDYWFGIDYKSSGSTMGLWASSNGSSWDLINADPGGNGISTGTPRMNSWNHVAVGRSSGTWSMWLNGTRVLNLTGITSAIVSRSAQAKIIGGWAAGSQYFVNGYMNDFRVVIGTDVYGVSNSTITVPTAPLAAITNTQLLTNFTNGGIIDNAMMNDLETVGNAQISTSVSKFGGGSLAFDGSGDYLIFPANSTFQFGTGDFTIEFWTYLNSVSGSQMFIDNRNSTTSTGAYITIYAGGSTLFFYTTGNDRITATSALSTGTWLHIAVARSGTSTKMFLNGTQVGSTYTDSNSYLAASTNQYIGARVSSNDFNLNGYIDDLRITKGYARYTANFTPPTAAFPTQ